MQSWESKLSNGHSCHWLVARMLAADTAWYHMVWLPNCLANCRFIVWHFHTLRPHWGVETHQWIVENYWKGFIESAYNYYFLSRTLQGFLCARQLIKRDMFIDSCTNWQSIWLISPSLRKSVAFPLLYFIYLFFEWINTDISLSSRKFVKNNLLCLPMQATAREVRYSSCFPY